MPGAEPRAALELLLAAPRGFCAGVDRAVQIVELALARFGAPVYVRHEIVHNRFVVESLEAKGAVFVDELDAVPAGGRVIFSAHGVPKSVPAEAERRELIYFDATCPLVSKVHREAERHWRQGRRIVMIGHAGHPEVIGTIGQLPDGAVLLVETAADVESLDLSPDAPLAYITQTTLSVEETATVIAALTRRFPAVVGPQKEDICYATTNRQAAVKTVAGRARAMLVIGAPNSSNSLRLVEVAKAAGCADTFLVQRAADIPWERLAGRDPIGISAGASAPEALVEEVIAAFRDRFVVRLEQVSLLEEDVRFKLPRGLDAGTDDRS